MGIVKIICKPDKSEFITIARGSNIYTDSLLIYPKLMYQDHNKDFWITDNNSIWLYKNSKLKKYTFDKKIYAGNFQRSYSITANSSLS